LQVAAYALADQLVSTLFVRPIFSLGDIVVIDPSEIDVLQLDGRIVAGVYVPRAETKRASEAVLRGLPAPANVRGHWPHLPEGLYLGWLGKSALPGGESISIHSAKVRPDDIPAQSTLEFAAPVATFHADKDTPGGGGLVPDEEFRLLGRVICWMQAPESSA
jgi:hypothetical protein